MTRNERILLDVMQYHINDFGTGIKYKLSVNPVTKDFTLTFPDQSAVHDNLATMQDRELLYFFVHPEMVDWIRGVKAKIEEERQFISDELSIFWVNGLCYQVETKKSGDVQVTLPEQERSFHVDSMYLDNPDFPLILDSLFDEKLRACLGKHGLNLPDVPYRVGISVAKK